MKPRSLAALLAGALAAPVPGFPVEVELLRDQQAKRRDGSRVEATPTSRRSHHHPLATAASMLLVESAPAGIAFEVRDGAGKPLARLGPVPAAWLVPRLRYPRTGPPDRFDAFNLRLAEFSRNGVRLPVQDDGDVVDVTVANNCLHPGMWELTSKDRSGETFHRWFTFPGEEYVALVARENGVPTNFAARAIAWSAEPAPVDLGRLRTPLRELGLLHADLDHESLFEPQDAEQRLKFATGFVARAAGSSERPYDRAHLLAPVYFTDFQPPGRYAPAPEKPFDLGFLLRPGRGRIFQVRPRALRPGTPGPWIDLSLELGDRVLWMGNLSLPVLRRGNVLRIHGYGVGIPGTSQTRGARARATQRDTFAYLIASGVDGPVAQNTHAVGLETIELRWRNDLPVPVLEVSLGSFERITTLARYRLAIPATLL